MKHTSILLTLTVAALAPSVAYGQGQSIDIELVRPRFSPRSTSGVDSPYIVADGRLDIGMLIQYQRDPLRLIEFDEVKGSVVTHRHVAQLGLSYAPSKKLSLRANLPVALHWGSEIERMDGDGIGLGDFGAGFRYQFVKEGNFTLGGHGDLVLNSGTRSSYMAEEQPRTEFGLLAGYDTGTVLVLSTLGVTTRRATDTELDFALGNELMWNTALVWTMPGEKTAITGEIISRYGMARLFRGGAESSMEWMAGFQYKVNKTWRVDAGFGRGITQGYGTSGYRGMIGVRYARTPKPQVEPKDFMVEVIDIPEDEPDFEDPPDIAPPPPPPEEWVAKIEDDQIVIRDPIQFEFATSRILVESIPTLRAVGALANNNGKIGHILIEGHASEEGTFEYNYDLSTRRAKAVFEQLIVVGVHPSRMSYRAMGEVVPKKQGDSESELASNRRVEFHIIKQYAYGDEVPEYEREIRLPWSGEKVTVRVPPPIPKPPPKPQDLLKDGDQGIDPDEAIRQLTQPDDDKPAPSQPTEPAKPAPAKPAETAPTKPAETAPAKPAETAPAKPAEPTPAKPAEPTPAASEPSTAPANRSSKPAGPWADPKPKEGE